MSKKYLCTVVKDHKFWIDGRPVPAGTTFTVDNIMSSNDSYICKSDIEKSIGNRFSCWTGNDVLTRNDGWDVDVI